MAITYLLSIGASNTFLQTKDSFVSGKMRKYQCWHSISFEQLRSSGVQPQITVMNPAYIILSDALQFFVREGRLQTQPYFLFKYVIDYIITKFQNKKNRGGKSNPLIVGYSNQWLINNLKYKMSYHTSNWPNCLMDRSGLTSTCILEI